MVQHGDISEKQTIIVLVECLKGGLNAGRFVFNRLTTNQRVVLLQVYDVQRGLFLMRDLSKVLHNTSYEELTRIKNQLISEFNIDSESIKKMVSKGTITGVLNHEFKNDKNAILVIGNDCSEGTHKIKQEKIFEIMSQTGIEKIFLIENDITFFNNSKTIKVYKDHKIDDLVLEKQ